MAGFQPAASDTTRARTNDGITVRVKDPEAQVVQFFYREQIVSGKHLAGLVNRVPIPFPNVYNPNDNSAAYDPTASYSKDAVVSFGGKYWIAIGTAVNKGNKPHTPSNFWLEATSLGCTGTVHSCYALTTDPMNPNWVPDAEPNTGAIYSSKDTQINCDGVTIFDSPSFDDIPGTIQRFTGLDYIIVNHRVKWTVTWKIEKDPSPDSTNPLPLTYEPVGFGGPPSPTQLKTFRDLLSHYNIAGPF